MYLLGLCVMLAIYFPVTRTTNWPTFLGMHKQSYSISDKMKGLITTHFYLDQKLHLVFPR